MADRGAVSAKVPVPCPPLAGSGLAQQALAGLAWCETFVVLGMHCFWVLSKSSPLAVDSAWGSALALLPFLLLLLAGLASFSLRMQAALIRLEPALHWTASLVFGLLLFCVTVCNPMTPVLPLAATMLPWSAGVSFLLLANLAVHLRVRASARACFATAPMWLAAALALFWWAATLWVVSGMTWAVYFWTASLLFHAAAAAAVPRQSGVGAIRGTRLLPFLEALFLLCMMALLQLRGITANAVMGNIEAKFPLFLAPCHGAVFFAGAALFLIARHFRLAVAVHVAVAVFLLVAPGELAWPSAVGLGYALPALFRATYRQGGFTYALFALAMAGVWLVGLGGFAFAGLVVKFGFFLDGVHVLVRGVQVALVISLLLWLGGVWYRRNRPARRAVCVSVPLPGMALCVPVFAVLLALAVIPGAALLKVTAWPPAFMAQPASRTVAEPMGLCHAGYSESDEEYKTLDELGVQSLRADFAWSSFQPGPDTWNFACRDGFVDAAARHGKKIIAILDYDNGAVEEDSAGKARGNYIAPADIPKFLEYVRQMVTHYTGRVDAWEIWNEPDITRFWEGPMDEFYALARQTADAIRIADPSAQIVGTACTGPFGALMASGIEGLHASGALVDVQHPSGHLYATNPRHYYAEFSKLIGMARRHDHPGSVWITELGAPNGGYYPWCANDDELAAHVIKSYTIATSLGVDRLVWYCFQDGDAAAQAKQPPDSESFFGLLGPGGQWKPSARAYSLFSKYCSDSTLRSDLVRVSGGLAARQLRTAFYRRDKGPSTLILWFEPALRPWGKARVHIDFEGLNALPERHDIGSGCTKTLTDDYIDVSGEPVFLTFGEGGDTDKVLHIGVAGSPVDLLWLVLAGGAVAGSLALCLHRRRGRSCPA